MTSRSGWASLIARVASWTTPSSSHAPEPSSSLSAGMPNSSTPGMPSAAASPASATACGDREAVDAGHRRDRRAALEAGLDEHRQDEVACVQARLAHEVAQDRGAAQPSQAGLRKGHARMVRRLFPLLDAFRRSSRLRVDCCEVAHRRRQALRCEKCPGAHSDVSHDVVHNSSGGSSPLSSIRSPRGSAAPPARARTARVVLIAALAASPRNASPLRPARISPPSGPIDPATQEPRLVPGLERAQARALPRRATVLPHDRRRVRRARRRGVLLATPAPT